MDQKLTKKLLEDARDRCVEETDLSRSEVSSEFPFDELSLAIGNLSKAGINKECIEKVVYNKLDARLGVDLLDGSSFGSNDVSSLNNLYVGDWINTKVTVTSLWGVSSDSINQIGLVADEQGNQIKFISWDKADLPELEVGGKYSVEDVAVSEDEKSDRYDMYLSFNSSTKISEIESNHGMDVGKKQNRDSCGEDVERFYGCIVDVKEKSGVVHRCIECNKVLDGGCCSTHGDVSGETDYRFKVVLDTGEETVTVILNENEVEKVTGIGLEKASKLVSRHGPEFLKMVFIREVIGHYYRIEGIEFENDGIDYVLSKGIKSYTRKRTFEKMRRELEEASDKVVV